MQIKCANTFTIYNIFMLTTWQLWRTY